MIKYNLKKSNWNFKNHPLDEKWAFLANSPTLKNNLCTVVDNHDEVENGKYTNKMATLLLHLSPRVRRYVSAILFKDFLYCGIWRDKDIPTYTNFDYKLEKLSKEQIVDDLFSVLYEIEPLLQTCTLVGYKGDSLLDNPNSYTGEYVLNDEEEYLICRNKKDVSFYHGEDKIYSGIIDEEKFRKSLEKSELKREICFGVEKLLRTGQLEEKIKKYESL